MLFGGVFLSGTLVRLVLGYKATELGLEGAFVAGLVAGYVTGAVTGGLVGLAALVGSGHEWLAVPLLVGVGALGGLLRDFAPGPEEVWRFSPFFPFAISNWFVRRPRSPEGAFQMLILLCCLGVEFIRINLGHTFERREALFVLYKSSNDLNPFTIALVYFAVPVCVGLTLKVWNATRYEWKLEEQQRLLMQARMASLTSQINPHFLFNTLNSVTSLIRSDRETARLIIFKLSTILRRLLRQQDAFTRLREEIAFIDDYLGIEQVRFGEKLKIVKEIHEDTLPALVPSMLLQPIVENSIKHGLSAKIGGGTIWLRSRVRGGRLEIEIEDDGVGVSEEAKPEIFQRGIGVSNVRERLQVLFGNEFNMAIEPRPGGGTCVRIEIPELQDPAEVGQAETVGPAEVEVDARPEAAAATRLIPRSP